MATLKPLSTLTDALSNSSSVSISNVHPMLKHIETQCATSIDIDVTEECLAVSRDIQKSIWDYIDSR